MSRDPDRYCAVAAVVPLPIAPRLESWDAAGSASQAGLAAYLRQLERLAAPLIAVSNDPLALAVDVALPPGADLLDQRDLDNYLLPAARHLMKATGRSFASVTGTKRHGRTSYFGIGQALAAAPRAEDASRRLRTTASADTAAYKQQIAAALSDARSVPPGPVALEILFRVGPARSWINLWKPTIDALGALLGAGSATRPWHPQDGRITRLSLHCAVDVALGHDVDLTIDARSA